MNNNNSYYYLFIIYLLSIYWKMTEPKIISNARKCLNRKLPVFDGHFFVNNIITGNKFVHELVLEMCDDPMLQTAVLKKLVYFTNFSTNYLLNIHNKQDKFPTIIQHLKQFITGSLNKEFYTDSNRMFIINFSFDEKDNTKTFDIISNPIHFINSEPKHIDISENLNNNKLILCRSIVRRKTINKWGIDGFLALLIINIDVDNLLNNPKSLKTLCEMVIVNQLEQIFNSSKNPRERLEICLDRIKKLPNFDFFESIHEINIFIQKVLFKHVQTLMFNIDYVFDYDESKLEPLDFSLHEYVINFFTIQTSHDWIIFLENILKLSDDELIKISYYLDKDISRFFFCLDHDNNFRITELKISKLEKHVTFDGYKYIDWCSFFDLNGACISFENRIYDNKLDIVNIKYSEPKSLSIKDLFMIY